MQLFTLTPKKPIPPETRTDPHAFQQQLFPHRRKPTPEELIQAMVAELKHKLEAKQQS